MEGTRKSHLIDAAERLILGMLAIAFFARFGFQVPTHPHYLLLLAGELFVLVMVLVRPWGLPLSIKPYPFAISLLGSMLPLFALPIGYNPSLGTVGSFIMLIGVGFALAGKVALNRRFGFIPANRGVQVRGPYAFVRHPIYAGYTITHLGFLITNPVLWNAALYSSALLFQILRIYEEERVLLLDPAYRTYAKRVRYRLLPGVF